MIFEIILVVFVIGSSFIALRHTHKNNKAAKAINMALKNWKAGKINDIEFEKILNQYK